MTKSMRLFATVVVFALIGGIVFAYAPVIKPLPTILIGDKEDWWGTVDTNLFRFSDAFDLDDFVTDEDNYTTEIIWSFWEGGAGNLLINGKEELTDLLTAVDADGGTKDIRSVKSTVDFWDQSNVPLGGTLGTYPDFDPDPSIFPAASTLDEVVTFFASDGLYVDSADMIVMAADNDFDLASLPAWRLVGEDDFEGTTGWTFFGPSSDKPDAAYTGATSSYDTHRLGVGTVGTTSRFGYWQPPTGQAVESNKLYKFAWEVSTNQEIPSLVPTVRFRINPLDFAYSSEMTVESAGSAPPFAPTATPKVYNQYLLPLSTGDMQPSFDVYDFSDDTGEVYLEKLEIYDIDVPAAGTPVSVPALNTWTVTTNVDPYDNPGSGTTGGLQLSSGVSANFVYGYWNSPNVADMVPDTLYRAVWTVASSDANPPNAFFRAQASDFQVSNRLKLLYLSAPDADGEDYTMYWEAHEPYGDSKAFQLVFEIGDFEAEQGGTITLSNVSVDSQPVIP